MRRWRMQSKPQKQQAADNKQKNKAETLDDLLLSFTTSDDFIQFTFKDKKTVLSIGYYDSLVDVEIIHRDVLPYLKTFKSISSLQSEIPIEDIIHIYLNSMDHLMAIFLRILPMMDIDTFEKVFSEAITFIKQANPNGGGLMPPT